MWYLIEAGNNLLRFEKRAGEYYEKPCWNVLCIQRGAIKCHFEKEVGEL